MSDIFSVPELPAHLRCFWFKLHCLHFRIHETYSFRVSRLFLLSRINCFFIKGKRKDCLGFGVIRIIGRDPNLGVTSETAILSASTYYWDDFDAILWMGSGLRIENSLHQSEEYTFQISSNSHYLPKISTVSFRCYVYFLFVSILSKTPSMVTCSVHCILTILL